MRRGQRTFRTDIHVLFGDKRITFVNDGSALSSYLGDEGRRLRDDKQEHDSEQHDGDLVLMAVDGATPPRQMPHHLGSHPSSGAERHDHSPTENSQRRQRNGKHHNSVDEVEIDSPRSS